MSKWIAVKGNIFAGTMTHHDHLVIEEDSQVVIAKVKPVKPDYSDLPPGTCVTSDDVLARWDKAEEETRRRTILLAAAPRMRDLLREVKEEWMHRFAGCGLDDCVICQQKDDFSQRLDALLQEVSDD